MKRASILLSQNNLYVSTGSGLMSARQKGRGFRNSNQTPYSNFRVPIDDKVVFTEEAGLFRNMYVRDADGTVINAMREVSDMSK